MMMRDVRMQAPIGIPIVGSLVAFILVTLALFSGKQPGFMEDYSIISFNTSELGKNLVPTAASSTESNKPTSCIPGINLGPLDKGCSAAASAAASVESTVLDSLRDIENDLADKLADKLGLKGFYSLHTMTLCEGNFSPNATAPGADYNVTYCTPALKTAQYNITALFDHELKAGPMKLSLASLGFTDDLQESFDTMASLLIALGVIFIIAMGATGLALLGAISALFLIPERAMLVFRVNSVLAGLSSLSLLVGCIASTVGALRGEKEVNERGDDIGLAATAGRKFIAITWASAALMLVTLGYWAVCWFKNRHGGSGFGRAHRHGAFALRKSESSSPPMEHTERMYGGRQENLPHFQASRFSGH